MKEPTNIVEHGPLVNSVYFEFFPVSQSMGRELKSLCLEWFINRGVGLVTMETGIVPKLNDGQLDWIND